MSEDRPRERRWRAGLVAWVAVSGVMMWLSPPPPPVPLFTAEEEAVWERTAHAAMEHARAWQEQRGDLSLPWDKAQGHLAIVIDDVGRELHHFEQLLALRYRLTFSVLPGSAYAVGAQLRLRQDTRRYREVLVHVPMEPDDGDKMQLGREAEEEFLQRSDEAATLRDKLARALAMVPAAVGANNHMGSALTAHEPAMRAVMDELAPRGLYFLDSRTASTTVAERVARARGVPVASRHVFLDTDPRPQEIRKALANAADRALNEPTVIIGHPSPAVVEVLREELPRLYSRGIAVYPLSEMMAHDPTWAPGPTG